MIKVHVFLQQEDEILKELKRCQGELRAVSQHNVQQLKRLQRLAQDEMKRQDIRKKLLNLDSEVLLSASFELVLHEVLNLFPLGFGSLPQSNVSQAKKETFDQKRKRKRLEGSA